MPFAKKLFCRWYPMLRKKRKKVGAVFNGNDEWKDSNKSVVATVSIHQKR
jgi:hypothetical protein